jgi:hypothetical protein
MKKELRLSLKKQWFDLTKAGVKTEDYREINEYWVSRLFNYKDSRFTAEEVVNYIIQYRYYGFSKPSYIRIILGLSFRVFDHNFMTLGYPKAGNTARILKLEHKGIEIRIGKPEWGAEPNKLYFVIMHGKIIEP